MNGEFAAANRAVLTKRRSFFTGVPIIGRRGNPVSLHFPERTGGRFRMSNLTQERPCAPSLDLGAFVEREQRLPRLGDVVPPWHYRGWLLAYVIQLHGLIPVVADRWGYHLRTLEAGQLLDEPIPQIAFGTPDNKVFSLLRDWSRLIGRDCGGWSDFRTLLDWFSWGLALTGEEPRLSE
jgi:hypothetical protein